MQLGPGSSSRTGGAVLPSGFGGEVKSEINVTPLVDVCLVLLIIFMVVTPLLQSGVDVALPSTRLPEKIGETESQLSIAVKANGDLFIGQNWVPKDQFQQQLTDIYNMSPGKDVVLKADRRLKYKDVRGAMEMINKAGFEGVALITTKRERL